MCHMYPLSPRTYCVILKTFVSSKNHNFSYILHMTLGNAADRYKFYLFLVLFQNDFITYKESVATILLRVFWSYSSAHFWLYLKLHYVMTSLIFISFKGMF